MRIDNAQLAAFALVVREGSFEAAARQLHITPSAVSQRIKLLEERLGQVLIRRSAPCQATDAGKALVRYTEELALLESEMLGALGSADAVQASLRMPIAVNADSLDSWFLAVFDAMPAEASIVFDLRVEDQDHSAALLREGAVMAAVSASAAPIQGCTVEPLGVMRYLAVSSPAYVARHFPAGVDARSLAAAPMLRFSLKDALQQQFIARFAPDAVQPPTHMVPSVHGFIALAKRGLGWGMVPEHFALPAIDAGELVEIAPGHYLDVPLHWHRWRLGSLALNTLSAAVRSVAATALRRLGDAAPPGVGP
ncbi:ArgP/LysG family DNA-binding transcriptional regulator [Aromatoleum toluvorans]|uniref:ArgP/LysG family DNA-binding transcriptional regulator n=1 Tax=Aromatoleum toluvorans TaxID=92002 RepID=A0ABX1PZU8_9RHOO|nr:LysR family transcriptional regulator ArgP [Aromatoleum toluvorans]NMG43626.1 ArgP/LysG family DNA-binding transcriptional regulator [Aromatoleum toluvorans]